MPEFTTGIGSPIKDFIRRSIKEVEAGVPKKYAIDGKIDFELSVVNTDSRRGGMDIKVLKLGGNVNKEQTQKIRFSVVNEEKAEKDVKVAMDRLEEFFNKLKKLDKKR